MESTQPPVSASSAVVDDQLLRRLIRQLRTIKIMLGLFFVMILGMLAILAFLAITVIGFTHDVSSRITNIQNQTTQTLDIKSKICGNPTFRGIVDDSHTMCPKL